MQIKFTEITVKVNLIPEKDRKHENMLATAFLTFKDAGGGYFTISGFTVWKSKEYAGLNVTLPGNKKFQYMQLEPGLWKKIKIEIMNAYEYKIIPIVG